MKRKSPYNSPNQKSPRGVNFFQQFSRQFLRPYGEADSAPSVETVLRRIQPFTCEWLLRPKIALSELSDTVIKNCDLLSNESDGIFTVDFKEYLQNELRPLEGYLKHLHKDCETPATENDVIQTLKFIYQENDELDGLIDQLFQLGGAMFVLAIQYIVARTLIRLPQQYAEQVQAEDGTDSVFHSNRDIKSMRDFIIKSVIGKSNSTPLLSPRRNLISEFDQPSPAKDSKSSSSKGRSGEEFHRNKEYQPSTSSSRKSSSSFPFRAKQFESRDTSQSSSSSSDEEEPVPKRESLQADNSVPPRKKTNDLQSVTQERARDVFIVKEETKSDAEEPVVTTQRKRRKKIKNPLELLAEDEPAMETSNSPTSETKNKKTKKGKK